MTAPSYLSELLRAATSALGAELGRDVARRFITALTETAGDSPPQGISAMALHNYARGSAFGQLGRSQVEAYVAARLASMDPNRADMLLRAAGDVGGGTIDGTLRQLARAFAEAQSG